MPTRRKITLLAFLLAALFASWPPTIASATASANPAEISKTASGDFSAPTHLASAISACNPRQALGKTPSATTEGVCAFSYGKEADQLSRLNYYGYRYYDELSLTWTQADPLCLFVPDIAATTPREMTLYAFSLNNPVRYMDPDGRQAQQTTSDGSQYGGGGSFGPSCRSFDFECMSKTHDQYDDFGKNKPPEEQEDEARKNATNYTDGGHYIGYEANEFGYYINSGGCAGGNAKGCAIEIAFTVAGGVIGKAAGKYLGPRIASLFGKADDTVQVFRVEGAGNQRLVMGADGAQTVIGDSTLFLNFGDESRAMSFLGKRLSQGQSSSVIKSFKVPKSFADDIAAKAVPERMSRSFPNAAIRVDTTKAANQFGLKKPQIEALRTILGGG